MRTVGEIQGYEPFGSLLPGRNYSSDSYRFGFNGKEKDDEVHGANGTSYDYGFRIYDPRVSRFLSIDPLSGSFPWYTPYQFAGNNPTWAIDLDGLEEYVVIHWMRNGALHATTIVKLTDEWKVDRQSREVVYVQMDHSRLQSFVSQNPQTGERSLVGEPGTFQRRTFDRFPDEREQMIRGGVWERQFRQDEQTMVDMGIPALDALERTNRSGTLASDGGAVFIFEPFAPNITFGSGSSELELSPLGKAELKSLRDKMVLLPDQNITIEGHTDNVGSDAANLGLSQRRADAAKDYVVGLGGVDAGRIETKGYGLSRPAADNATPEGRQQNRRVEITPR